MKYSEITFNTVLHLFGLRYIPVIEFSFIDVIQIVSVFQNNNFGTLLLFFFCFEIEIKITHFMIGLNVLLKLLQLISFH